MQARKGTTGKFSKLKICESKNRNYAALATATAAPPAATQNHACLLHVTATFISTSICMHVRYTDTTNAE